MNEPKIIAITGGPSTGKTTVSRLLGEKFGFPVRNCGEIVKARAGELCCMIDDLPQSEHLAIDSQTREWIKNRVGDCIVEGRFLRDVLSDQANVLFIELTCSLEEQARRSASREAGVSAPPRFRQNFSAATVNKALKVIDTNDLSPADVVTRIGELLREDAAK